MTAAELLAAGKADARIAYRAYESMPTEELQRLQLDHQLELVHAQTPEGIAFGGGRLALIAAVLRKRGVGA
jgi:hypothetical protein